MSKLLVQPNLDSTGVVHNVTPASAGWSYVGFGLHDISAGTSIAVDGTGDEVCLVLLSGSACIHASPGSFLGFKLTARPRRGPCRPPKGSKAIGDVCEVPLNRFKV